MSRAGGARPNAGGRAGPPDTADDTRERFLRAIAERVPLMRVSEVHLFPAIRQGGAESGVAVIAALPPDDLPAPVGRHTIFSARYRLALKGPDRGKWEIVVEVEADAPLAAVDRVVRGVQQRAGEAGDPERLDGDALRALLGVETLAVVDAAGEAPVPDGGGDEAACQPPT
jgi:hypothetical protein